MGAVAQHSLTPLAIIAPACIGFFALMVLSLNYRHRKNKRPKQHSQAKAWQPKRRRRSK